MSTPRFVIVGAGLAGAKTAESLREAGFDGRVTLIGAESERPYERPPLSKGILQGTAEPDSASVHDAQWYATHDVDLLLGVQATDIDGSSLLLDDGARLDFDRLAITTGSRPRRLDLRGSALPGIHYLRTLPDALALRTALSEVADLVIVGAGWIGLEVAAAARAANVNVTVLEAAPLPLLRVLGPQMAGVFAALHRDHGVQLEFEVGVEAFEGEERVRGVRLGDGRVLAAQAVVIGVGIVPNVEVATGLDIDNGILADEHLQTSHPDVVAAGDVVNAMHPVLGRRIRVEHWANALNQPGVAARTMLGQPATYDRLPYFYTDQYDVGMEYVGHADASSSELIVRGDEASREFLAFWLSDGRVQAGMAVNIWDVVEPIRELILSGRRVDLARLADPDVSLSEV